ncbi:hypothetical protein A2W54_00485 [Candidatus Giovannonibacteria bacterium RIFCSPHIGHO2_02_43_13]|uniref:DUF559 domain-containing protein n=1 Tax=Candidatus Giovannonibacteria bacterium RIFCSPHIGHO2_02_43_13 TaxID=1798330 RepID=A0A1F5WSI5_9BACT|nr:MAG: hypothetical protein A3E06_03495 [Candidatus Giovannonibacteria bacterium RIFCSPHIGHO2_12_FULL_44_42]OGF78619.1 MAG: hypothetical protein A2W54_00485 [Candidatus Giovannonibacteria bacterium RIFCSPHIGHO2_02_43_13]OGF89819.1 MAG: hypothetical protein A3I94_01090 [Candidatus Giovannonibacteria bacterium RIFCSPLOWO2_02_FULL_43_54]OGF97141.1 MAG: hypothetical protein A3H08_03305 [Candidatus Giovannonibacteria bacterium RIFCSPLOWO2_12_FULL_44_32]
MTEIFNKKSQTIKRRILRNNMTRPELLLWTKLKNKQMDGYRFRRQFSIGRYVADFYCPELKLVIEIDGPNHNTKENIEYDRERDLFMHSLDINIIRISNSQILDNIDEAIVIIKTKIPFPLTKGEG